MLSAASLLFPPFHCQLGLLFLDGIPSFANFDNPEDLKVITLEDLRSFPTLIKNDS